MDCSDIGCFSLGEIVFPQPHSLKSGAVAVVECAQEIPCNPCSEFCPRGAIRVGDNINSCPSIDWALCNGCGLCLGHCPGLAIFLLDNRGEYPRISLAWEMMPPELGCAVRLLDRSGRDVGLGKVVACRQLRQHDRCSLVTLELEHAAQLQQVRGFCEVKS